jgi:hypothetical protein
MTERSMAELMGEVGFLLDDFDKICRYAFGTYRAYTPDVLVEHDARAAAACTYAHMAAEAERRLSAHPKIKPLDWKKLGGLKIWLLGDIALVRFKKQDEDGKSKNYPTKQAKAYDRGLPLPGLPAPAARLSIGYLLDSTGTEFIRTQVARPLLRTIDWCAAIVPVEERRHGEALWKDVTKQAKL